jgi:hypothetical protein
MSHLLEDKNTRLLEFNKSKIQDVLPEYFTGEYPQFVRLLEEYYNFLDSTGANSFDREIHQLLTVRDLDIAPEAYLSNLVAEYGAGLQNSDPFQNPRFTLRRFADFYRSKGSIKSIEEFFRTFYQSEVTVEYPKENIFIVGQSRIGPESLRFIQDYRKYQLYSILLKVGIGVRTYLDTYKKYVHPAGWYIEGEVSVIGEAKNNFFFLNDSADVWIQDSTNLSFVGEATVPFVTASSYTGLYDSTDGHAVRFNIDQTFIEIYQNYTIEELDRFYTAKDLMGYNAFTFDDSGTVSRPGFSIDDSAWPSLFDQSMFTRYTSDSAY